MRTNNIFKRRTAVFLALIMAISTCLFAFSGCGKTLDTPGNPSASVTNAASSAEACKIWDYTEDDAKEAVELSASVTEAGEKVDIVLSYEGNAVFSSSLTPDDVIVYKKAGSGEESEEKVKKINSYGDLKKAEVNGAQTMLAPDLKQMNVSVPASEATGDIYILVNRRVSTLGKYMYAGISFNDLTEQRSAPTAQLLRNSFTAGESDPVIEIATYGLTVSDPKKISFDGAFSTLSVKKTESESHILTVAASGTVTAQNKASVILENGFFKETSEKIILSCDIESGAAYIPEESFSFHDGRILFDVILSEQTVNKSFSSADVEADFDGGFDIAFNEGDNKFMLNAETKETSLSDAICELNGKVIKISGGNLSKGLDVSATVSGRLPRIYVFGEMVSDTVDVDLLVYSGYFKDLSFSDLTVTGDLAGKEPKNFYSVPKGYHIVFECDNDLTDFNGSISVAEDKIYTMWDDMWDSLTADYSISAMRMFGISERTPEQFESDLIKNGVLSSEGIRSFTDMAKIAVAVYGLDPGAAAEPAMDLLKVFRIIKPNPTVAPTLLDVMEKLGEIDKKIDQIDRNIGQLKDTLRDSSVAVEMGINAIKFNQYRAEYESFFENYVQKLENRIRDINAGVYAKMRDITFTKGKYTVEIKYGKSPDGTDVISVESPYDEGYTVDGYEIVKTDSFVIGDCSAAFAQAAAEWRKVSGYSSSFDAAFMDALTAEVNKQHPGISQEEAEATAYKVYTAIIKNALYFSISPESAKEFVNLFVNFCSQLTGSRSGTGFPKIQYYFSMLESLYNFQCEAEDSFRTYRATIKAYLLKHSAFAAMCCGISGNSIEDIASGYASASKMLNDYTNIHDVSVGTYCYVTESPVYASAINATFNPHLDGAGNNSRFSYYYVFQNWSKKQGEMATTICNDFIISSSDLMKIQKRLDNLKKIGLADKDLSLKDYLIASKMLSQNVLDRIEREFEYNVIAQKTTAYYKDLNVITSYNGISELTEAIDMWHTGTNFYMFLSSYYFNGYPVLYKFKGKGVAKLWQGKKADGEVFSLVKGKVVSDRITSVANYDESHWYWVDDEHHYFEEHYAGFKAIIFFKDGIDRNSPTP